ncbi:MAG TPA: ABC transporter substrate-binding protein [Acidimicrobiales bacterium]|nr:ABC transporter substrate-binding protein [Acidimicrobiales bacterium]
MMTRWAHRSPRGPGLTTHMDMAQTRRTWGAALVGTLVVAGATSIGATNASAASFRTASSVGTTLTIALAQYPPSLDPASGQNAYSDYFDLAYDPLIVKEPNGAFEPRLAKAWSYGPDNESFSITLRSGVKFSDGSALTAEAVKAWIKHEVAFPGGAGAGYFKSLSAIDITGPLSLTMHFSAPTPELELVFSQVLEMGEIGSPSAITGNKLTTATDGTGEYMLEASQTVTGETYTYVPNPYYWDPAAVHWKTVVIKVITNPSAALAALETGQVDVAEVQPITNAAAAKAAGLKVNAPLTLYMALALENRNAKPLSSLLVRQALNYAVNRSAIAKLLGSGYGLPIDEMAVPGDDSYDPALANYYRYDPDKAKQLLAEAGYPHGFTLPVLSLAAAQQNTLAEALQGQLASVGVTLQPDITSSVDQYETDISGTTYSAVTLSWGRLPAVTQYQILWGPDGQSSRPFHSNSPELDGIYNKLIAAPPSQVAAFAQSMQKFLVEQAWYLPVAATPLAGFYRADITGVNATPQRNTDYDVEFAPAS